MSRLEHAKEHATDARARSSDRDGSIVVATAQSSASNLVEFIWSEQHGLRDLEQVLGAEYGLALPSWTLTHASATPPSGDTNVGWGMYPSGFTEAWIARSACRPVASDCNANACNGQLSVDWSAFIAANPGALGAPFSELDTLYVQAWFRDPPSPKTTALSNALSVVLCP